MLGIIIWSLVTRGVGVVTFSLSFPKSELLHIMSICNLLSKLSDGSMYKFGTQIKSVTIVCNRTQVLHLSLNTQVEFGFQKNSTFKYSHTPTC